MEATIVHGVIPRNSEHEPLHSGCLSTKRPRHVTQVYRRSRRPPKTSRSSTWDRDNGKENGNYRDYRGYNIRIIGCILWLYRDNGEENAN